MVRAKRLASRSLQSSTMTAGHEGARATSGRLLGAVVVGQLPARSRATRSRHPAVTQAAARASSSALSTNPKPDPALTLPLTLTNPNPPPGFVASMTLLTRCALRSETCAVPIRYTSWQEGVQEGARVARDAGGSGWGEGGDHRLLLVAGEKRPQASQLWAMSTDVGCAGKMKLGVETEGRAY